MKNESGFRRRQWLAMAGAVPFALRAWPALAQSDYPNKPIKFIVPFAPGGSLEVLGRHIGTKLQAKMGQALVFENRPGANSQMGTSVAARLPADGYNLLMGADSGLSISPILNKALTYHPERDFAPLSILCQISLLLIANASFGPSTLQEFIAYAKANPGKVAYSSPGVGSQHHIMFEALATRLGLELLHVPYQGIAPSVNALLAGEVNVMMAALALPLPYVRSGRLKTIAFGGNARHPLLPNVPTFAEAGVPGFEARSWFGAFAPAGTPRDIVQKLSANIWEIVASKEFSEGFLIPQGYDPVNTVAPEQFPAFLREDRKKWEAAIAQINPKRLAP
ncbi:tripartite tricarboxylate transporter substrate binding protein [Ramlibacter ginsenosidimutans]|uniref:Tripartite tricarboxylate transporter substrate binding protein n=1 Tax=Ramlibacter ginsenosidimutans TaxID=502333 RepID=A0A934TTA9_9BURK|nr:tripartite tricarboxylate transporter substrate-binding protein [Ramlibacter ginsenosidimutans]MBK6007154.1 tripartite tricarboxylate transporter substrate binding protein [Ramlibacter ginsenosidimutans]